MHVSWPGVLHHDVPEGDGEPTRALTFPPQTEHAASSTVVELGPGVHHGAVLYDQRVVVGKVKLTACSYGVREGYRVEENKKKSCGIRLFPLSFLLSSSVF